MVQKYGHNFLIYFQEKTPDQVLIRKLNLLWLVAVNLVGEKIFLLIMEAHKHAFLHQVLEIGNKFREHGITKQRCLRVRSLKITSVHPLISLGSIFVAVLIQGHVHQLSLLGFILSLQFSVLSEYEGFEGSLDHNDLFQKVL